MARKFFAEPDDANRRKLAEQFGALDIQDWATLRQALRKAAVFADLKPGMHKLRAAAQGDIPATDYILRIPDSYDRNRDDGWPLIIGCHGTGGSGDKQMALLVGLLGSHADKYLIACPEAPQDGLFTATRALMEYPLVVLADVRRRANVNSDRVILTGYSKGGYTTWAAAMFSPGEWGGAAPMAAFPLAEAGTAGITLYMPNLSNLDIQAHWGANDIVDGQSEGINTFNREATSEMRRLRHKRYEAIEYPNQGHGLKLDAERFAAFLESARREPFPDRGKLVFHALHQGRAWYVTALKATKPDFDFTSKRTVIVDRVEDVRAAKRKLLTDESMEISINLESRNNLLRVTGRNISEVEIVLPLEKLNWSRPMRIFFGPRLVQSGPPKVDWFELLETVRRTQDFERLIGGRITASAVAERR